VVRKRQDEYLADSDPFTREGLARFGIVQRIWQNLLATMSPVL
jgi:cardiolipin synthase